MRDSIQQGSRRSEGGGPLPSMSDSCRTAQEAHAFVEKNSFLLKIKPGGYRAQETHALIKEGLFPWKIKPKGHRAQETHAFRKSDVIFPESKSLEGAAHRKPML